MTRYLDPGITLTGDAETYARALGVAYDVVGLPLSELHAGDVVITGPWSDMSWLPSQISIEVVPDNTPPAIRRTPLAAALKEAGLSPSMKPPTPRHKDYERYEQARRWAEEVTTLIRVGTSAPPYLIAEDIDSAREVIRSLHGRPFAFDLETDSLDPRRVKRWGAALADEKTAWWIPDTVAPYVLPDLVSLLQNNRWRASNAKYDMTVLSVLANISPDSLAFVDDTQVLNWITTGGGYQNDLKHLSRHRLGRNVIDYDTSFWDWPLESQALYAAAGDARNSFDLVTVISEDMSSELLALYERFEAPIIPILAEMELSGIPIDSQKVGAVIDEYTSRMEEAKKRLAEAGFDGNPNSSEHVASFLYDTLKYPIFKFTNSSQRGSVANGVLRRLYLELINRDLDASVVRLFMDLAECQKALSTFLWPWQGRDVIHPGWRQTSVVTGRLSSSPNVQNFPRSAALREIFAAPDGMEIVDADYSQIEPRLAAHYSQDPKMLDDFRSGRDVYLSLGKDMGLEDFDRHNLKVTYLADMYIVSPPQIQAIAMRQGRYISIAECRKMQEGIHRVRPVFFEWRRQLIERARQTGVVKDMFGRFRNVGSLNAIDPATRAAAERETANFPIQAGAGGIIKGAMPAVHKLFKEAGGYLINQIHDELLGCVKEMPASEMSNFMRELKSAMTWIDLSVPLLVEAGHGKTWLKAKGE